MPRVKADILYVVTVDDRLNANTVNSSVGPGRLCICICGIVPCDYFRSAYSVHHHSQSIADRNCVDTCNIAIIWCISSLIFMKLRHVDLELPDLKIILYSVENISTIV